MPFKVYKAKISGTPKFNFVCFSDKKKNERIYKGEGTLKFICYFPYAYCFDKYIIRTADYYKCFTPEQIIEQVKERNQYIREDKKRISTEFIKEHYNKEKNMSEQWKGGYPTIEQVQNGELFFNLDNDENKKRIIEVNGYWDNIPKWQSTAKLLTTPTLDYDQELIYLPQFNKFENVNMDIGQTSKQAVIGSRLLVYNPGDLPIDFKLELKDLKQHLRGFSEGMRFKIQRFNVQRLTIPEAVDHINQETAQKEDQSDYKYANRYYKDIVIQGDIGENNEYEVSYKLLKTSHPKHSYIVEPIPKEKLANYIKLFYWQSFNLKEIDEWTLNYGIKIAEKYDNDYKDLTEKEQCQLYWDTLKLAIVSKYVEKINRLLDEENKITEKDFIDEWIWNPPEYIKEDKNIEDNYKHKYGQIEFNLSKLPPFITEDYLLLNTDRIKDFKTPIYIDTEKRSIYYKEKAKMNFDKTSLDFENFYSYKESEISILDCLEQGHWFKLPQGWSLIDFSPIVDEDYWGGKTWKDAKPFLWSSYQGDSEKIGGIGKAFEKIYNTAVVEYVSQYYRGFENGYYKYRGKIYKKEDNEHKSPLQIGELEEFLKFKTYNKTIYKNYYELDGNGMKIHNIADDFNRKKNETAEYVFLKMLAFFWKQKHSEEISSWFFSAENYLWTNFPPLYWGYVDVLNNAKIEYTPIYY